MKLFYKLVRDKIPEIIKSQGKTCDYNILDDADYFDELKLKLEEEVHEYIENPCIEELADIGEVMLTLMNNMGITIEELQNAMLKKREERGGFSNKVFLQRVHDDE